MWSPLVRPSQEGRARVVLNDTLLEWPINELFTVDYEIKDSHQLVGFASCPFEKKTSG